MSDILLNLPSSSPQQPSEKRNWVVTVQTDKYAGNFERPMAEFVFGRIWSKDAVFANAGGWQTEMRSYDTGDYTYTLPQVIDGPAELLWATEPAAAGGQEPVELGGSLLAFNHESEHAICDGHYAAITGGEGGSYQAVCFAFAERPTAQQMQAIARQVQLFTQQNLGEQIFASMKADRIARAQDDLAQGMREDITEDERLFMDIRNVDSDEQYLRQRHEEAQLRYEQAMEMIESMSIESEHSTSSLPTKIFSVTLSERIDRCEPQLTIG